MAVDEREGVDQSLSTLSTSSFSLCPLPHPLEEGPLVASVAEHHEVLVLSDLGSKNFSKIRHSCSLSSAQNECVVSESPWTTIIPMR